MPNVSVEDIKKAFDSVEELLNGMMSDRSVPRNIKRVTQKSISELHKEDESAGVISSNVMYMVDELALDPNIPFHSRTTIYRIISILEKIKD